MRTLAVATLLTFCAFGIADAQTIDGRLAGDESFYGTALSIQDTRTGFGNNTNPDPILNGNGGGSGSEINQVFAKVDNGRLHVFIAGNLEGGNLGNGDNNFNKLNVFIDSVAGGVNSLDGANLPAAMDGFCCGGLEPPRGNNTAGEGALQRMSGLTFDSGFDADYHLIFTHGGENVTAGSAGATDFWAITSHFSDLTDGANGASGALGMQLAPNGEPRVLRSPATGSADGDYNDDGNVDAADYTVWRDNLGTATVLPNDPTGGTIGTDQYDTWKANFGAGGASGGAIGDFAFKPSDTNPTASLISSFTLQGLGQGELIDRDYALSADGGCTDDTGEGCLAREFAFTLDVAPDEQNQPNPEDNNASNHRDLRNFVDLRMGFDNSNVAGVEGGGPFETVVGEDDPENVGTGLEFSIPLDQIGNPASGDIKLTIFVNGGGHDFLSNQFAGAGTDGGIVNTTALGEDGGNLATNAFGAVPAVTLADIPMDQFITVPIPAPAGSGSSVPEPTTALLACLLCWVACGVRRNA